MLSIDSINPAFNAMKELLFPFNLRKWLRLGLVSLLAGSGSGGGFSSPGSLGQGARTGTNAAMPKFDFNAFISQYGLITGIGIIILILVSLVLSFIQSVFSFIFLENLIEKNDRVLSAFGRNSGKGFSYFLFKLLLGLIALVSLGLFALPVILALMNGANIFGMILMVIVLLLLWVLTFGLALGLIEGFTRDFALPLMLLKNKGIKESWHELKPLIKKEWKEFLLYIFVSFFVGIAAGIIAIILLIPLIIIGVIIAIALLVGGAITVLAGGTINWTLLMIAIPFLIIGLIVFFYAAAVITLPVSVFLRYYPLVFLGKIDTETGKMLEKKGIEMN